MKRKTEICKNYKLPFYNGSMLDYLSAYKAKGSALLLKHTYQGLVQLFIYICCFHLHNLGRVSKYSIILRFH